MKIWKIWKIASATAALTLVAGGVLFAAGIAAMMHNEDKLMREQGYKL